HLHSFSIYTYGYLRDFHSFPTRRSSDLSQRSRGLRSGQETDSCPSHHEGEYAISPEFAQRLSDLARNSRRSGINLHRYRCRLIRSEEHTSELQSPYDLVCRLLLEKKNKT